MQTRFKYLALGLVAAISFGAPQDAAQAATLDTVAPDSFSGEASVRFRSFRPTGGEEVYLGTPDLGVAANRVADDYDWSASGATAFDFFFAINLNVDELFVGLPAEDPDAQDIFSLFGDYTADPTINAFKITVADRDADGEVWLSNLSINGVDYDDPTDASSEGFNDFYALNIAPGDFYFVSGTINRTGVFRNSQELSRIEITGGFVPPAVPLPAAAWMLMAGVGGLVVAGRRKRKSS